MRQTRLLLWLGLAFVLPVAGYTQACCSSGAPLTSSLPPQLQLDFDDFGLDLRAEWPLYRQLRGTQLTTSYQLRLALSYRINNGARPLNEL